MKNLKMIWNLLIFNQQEYYQDLHLEVLQLQIKMIKFFIHLNSLVCLDL